jgi:hypothetical protein
VENSQPISWGYIKPFRQHLVGPLQLVALIRFFREINVHQDKRPAGVMDEFGRSQDLTLQLGTGWPPV